MSSVTALQRPESLASWLRFGGALALVPMTLLCIWIWFGLSRPSPVLVLEGYQMVVLAPAWIILIGAVVGRHWIMALVALFVAVSHLWFCLPAATANARPAWADEAPSFTMYSANILYQNPDFSAVATDVLDRDAEVVIINEMTDAAFAVFDEAGVFDRYRTVEYWPDRVFGELIMTRLDVSDSGIDNIGGMGVPWVVLDLEGTPAKVFAIHVGAPKNSGDRHVWRRNLDAIGSTVENRDGVAMVFAGDFNSTLWHGPFRRLLARGLTDGHDQRGQGLARSWRSPVVPLRWLGPIMGLDHVLVSDDAYVASIDNVTTPGSDHQGLVTTVSVRPK